MKKILKWTGITLGGLFLLLLILPFAFSGKIESAIKDAANENLNARVNWSDVSLSLIRNFPNLRISIENLTVDNTTYPFDSVRMASIGSLEAVVDFKSLFGDQITIKRNSIFALRLRDWPIMILPNPILRQPNPAHQANHRSST
jgi:uncharacterized protein involved in outer membrane biogenesis